MQTEETVQKLLTSVRTLKDRVNDRRAVGIDISIAIGEVLQALQEVDAS